MLYIHENGINNLESLPNLPLFLILSYLIAHDLTTLHLTSNLLFKRCSEYLTHITAKHKSNGSVEHIWVRPCVRSNDTIIYKNRSNEYKDCSPIRRKCQFPAHSYICMDLERLKNHEMTHIIDFYKDRMQYFFFKQSKARFSFFPISGIRFGYHHIEKIYRNPNLNYEAMCETYQNLSTFTPVWDISTSDLPIKNEVNLVSAQTEKRVPPKEI